LLVCVSSLFDLILRVNAANVRDIPISAGHLENVQQEVMRAQSMVLLGDELDRFKVVSRFTSNALDRGNQHGLVV